MGLSEEIKVIREKSLLTQEDFAKEIGVAASTVNRWETNKARPNMSAMRSIKKFCEQYKLSYKEIEQAWIEH